MADTDLKAAIVQDADTNRVLMLAWMDEEALRRTKESGQAWFFSRSRQELWHKGETSGSFLNVEELKEDCDGDAILVRAHPKGPVCHTGTATCWGDDPAPPLARTLSELGALLRERKRDLPERSYSAELFRKGRGAIAQKVGEEALELSLAAVSESTERTLSEFTDLVYALLVLATELGLTSDDVVRSLAEKKRTASR